MPTTFLGYERLKKKLMFSKAYNKIESILILLFLLVSMIVVSVADSFNF